MDENKILLALAAVAGGVITKLMDVIALRFKTLADGRSEERSKEQELASKLRDELWREFRELKREVKVLEDDISNLREENIQLKAENSRLQSRIEELEGKLRNYYNQV
jgi:septal ring factor EnvC (AmiA/AmiB activator)